MALARVAAAPLVLACASVGWFGNMGRWTPWVHRDDHSDLARQAFGYLLKEGKIAPDSPLSRHRSAVQDSCGLLDIMEGKTGGRVPGKLQWDYSHMYDPLRRCGVDRHHVNALDEFCDLWERSLVHHRIESDEKAYRFLGYCCHLLQDMAVPSHTHCITHGLRSRAADNLELRSRAKRFYLREPAGPPYPGERRMHVKLFLATGRESRGLESYDDVPNDVAELLPLYYEAPRKWDGGWQGRYVGEPYYPYHRLLPSTPALSTVDLLSLRNYLMTCAAERTAQLLLHYAELTGTGGAAR